MLKNMKAVMKYFAIPLTGLLVALVALIMRWTPGTSTGIIGTALLKILLIITIGVFIMLYIGISRKWFVKVPARMDVKSWLRYTLLWGLLYSGVGLLVLLPLVTFYVLLISLPGIADAVVVVRDFMREKSSVLLWLPALGFLAGNIGFFLYGCMGRSSKGRTT